VDKHQRKDAGNNTDDGRALEADNPKDTPSFGTEDLEIIHRSSAEAGLLGIYNFPGVVYATDGSNDKDVIGAGFYRLDENRGECCKLGRGEEGNSSNRAELGAACLELEDAKGKENRKLIILLSDSACFLFFPPKMDRVGKIPFHVGEPGRGHHERHRTTSTRTNRTRTTYRFHQNKSPPRRPPKRTSR